MSDKWYPVIDYITCIDCGVCVDKCQNSVYDQTKSPTPVVLNPVNCSEGCHGCGKLCPTSSITYVGDVKKKDSCNCGGRC